MTNTFSISKAVKFGWETTKKNFGFLLGIMLVAFVAPQIVMAILSGDPGSSSYNAWSLISWIYSMVVTVGMIVIAMKFVRGEKPEFSDLFNNWSVLLKYIGGMILYGLMVLAGFILLVIPGIYLALKFQFVGYFIVDKKMGPIEALKASGQATQGKLMKLLLLYFVLIGISLLGLLALFVGILVAMPVIMLAYAYIYNLLSQDVAVSGEVVSKK